MSDLDLSRLKVLRSLQVDWVVDCCLQRHRPTAVPELLSTVTSPVFSEFIIGLPRYDTRLHWADALFRPLSSISQPKHFGLTFSLEYQASCEARRALLDTLDPLTAKGLFDFLDSPPIIRVAQPRHYKWDCFDPD